MYVVVWPLVKRKKKENSSDLCSTNKKGMLCKNSLNTF